MDRQYEVTSSKTDLVAGEKTFRNCANSLVIEDMQVKLMMHFTFWTGHCGRQNSEDIPSRFLFMITIKH